MSVILLGLLGIGVAVGFSVGWFGRDLWTGHKKRLATSQIIVNGHEVARQAEGGYKCRHCGAERTTPEGFGESSECTEWAMVT